MEEGVKRVSECVWDEAISERAWRHIIGVLYAYGTWAQCEETDTAILTRERGWAQPPYPL